MGRQRGSTTVMALTAMFVLAAGSTSYVYVANRNMNVSAEYNNTLQAQYSAEAGMATIFVAGQESINPVNGYSNGGNRALADWADLNQPIPLALPGRMGTAQVMIRQTALNDFNIDVRSTTLRGASRLASNRNMNLTPPSVVDADGNSTTSAAELIRSALRDPKRNWTSNTNGETWQLPADVNDMTSPAKSPGSGTTNGWMGSSAVLFNDILGKGFTPTTELKLVFRVNSFVTLTNVPGSGSGSGYGIYYLTNQNTVAGDPTAYVLQFDPGLNPSFSPPTGGAWGASFTNPVSDWPYGAFLVKKAWSDGSIGGQNEVWDESGGYQVHYAFRDNNELAQRYYKKNTSSAPYSIQPLDLGNSATWALRAVSTSPSTTPPTVTRVPTVFGADFTGKYHVRPPDLRIAYTLGNIAEGNPWQKSTYYPVGAKVLVGVGGGTNALKTRMVWVAKTAGVSNSTAKPTIMSSVPLTGATVSDGGVTWEAKPVPTPEEVAKSILNYSPFSLAKISMSDLKFRVDSVNGTTPQDDPYHIPFNMLMGSKNKLTVELYADSLGNRVHVIRVNDVFVLGFNDRAGTTHDILPANWELSPGSSPRGTGLRIWQAAAEFYTVDNYGQSLNTSYGTWGN